MPGNFLEDKINVYGMHGGLTGNVKTLERKNKKQ